MTFLRRIPRRLIQLTCFVGAVVLVWPVLPWAIAPRSFVQASPFVALASSIATRSISLGVVFAAHRGRREFIQEAVVLPLPLPDRFPA